MSDALERAIDNMADELAAMGKAMSRDSKRIEQLQSENERLRAIIDTLTAQRAVGSRFTSSDTK